MISESEMQDVVSEIDVGGNGGNSMIEFDEFVLLFVRKFTHETALGFDQGEAEELRDAFAEMDKDQDGVVSETDMRQAFAELGDDYSMLEIREMMAEVKSSFVAQGSNQLSSSSSTQSLAQGDPFKSKSIRASTSTSKLQQTSTNAPADQEIAMQEWMDIMTP